MSATPSEVVFESLLSVGATAPGHMVRITEELGPESPELVVWDESGCVVAGQGCEQLSARIGNADGEGWPVDLRSLGVYAKEAQLYRGVRCPLRSHVKASLSDADDDLAVLAPGTSLGVHARGGHDYITGTSFSDTIDGGNGNDKIFAGADRDTLVGGAGDDDLYGGAGLDNADGGPGSDLLSMRDGNDEEDLECGADLDKARVDATEGPGSGCEQHFPESAFTVDPPTPRVDEEVSFRSTASDPDGGALTHVWDFGDGTTRTGPDPSHRYASAGWYYVALTVRDDQGNSDTSGHSVLVSPPGNRPPEVQFTSPTASTVGEVVSFHSIAGDPDGDALTHDWDFGDGGRAATRNATHIYSAAGTYEVTLTVSDGRGGTGSSTRTITINPPPNRPPVASFTFDPSAPRTGEMVTFTSTASDPDGDALTYEWSFQDGARADTPEARHAFADPGTYFVTLTVTDGRTAVSTARAVTVTEPPANRDPVASFSFEPATPRAGDAVRFASGSSDPDGDVLAHAWDFGDGTTGAGSHPSHEYAAAGTYAVRLTVTDGRGGQGSVSRSVTVAAPPAANQPPIASFSFDPPSPRPGQEVIFRSASSDPDGDPLDHAWTFGDGGTASGAAPRHAYAGAGTHTVTLTVTDAHDARDIMSRTITVMEPSTPAANRAPTATFDFAPSVPRAGELVSFVPASGDPDGDAVTHAWDFGDGTTAATDRPSHTYRSAGSYTVRLTVTDSKGAHAVVTRTVTVLGAAPQEPPADNPPGRAPAPAGQHTPRPDSSTAPRDPASYCNAFERRTARGRRAWSRCVAALVRLAEGRAESAPAACRRLSARRRGARPSDRSLCVRAGRAFLRDRDGRPR